MKLNILTAAMLFTLAAATTSCKKDKVDDVSIVGKWIVKGYDGNDFYAGASHYSSGVPYQGANIELKSGGTFFATSISSFSSGTWTSNGTMLTITATSGSVEVWAIKKLTKTELVLYETDKDRDPTDYFEMTVYCER